MRRLALAVLFTGCAHMVPLETGMEIRNDPAAEACVPPPGVRGYRWRQCQADTDDPEGRACCAYVIDDCVVLACQDECADTWTTRAISCPDGGEAPPADDDTDQQETPL